MNEVGQVKTDSDGLEGPSDWLAKLDRGLTKREEARFTAWLFENDDNYSAFMKLARLWDRMDALAALAGVMPEPARPKTPWRRYVLPIAATLLLSAFLTYWISANVTQHEVPGHRAAEESRTYETAVGERSSFELEDGTRIVLNTNSSVRVRYTSSNRLLYLERGEMHVAVERDLVRPLSVLVGNHVAQAVGTEFNVEITDDRNIELIVTEGVVMVGIVDPGAVAPSSDEPIALTPQSTLVTAGQGAVIEHNGNGTQEVERQPLSADDIAVRLSWREGNLIFRGESLEEAVSEVGRYTSVEFVFLDEYSRKVRVAGLFKAGDVEGLLAALRQNFNISYEWVAENKIALSGETDTQ